MVGARTQTFPRVKPPQASLSAGIAGGRSQFHSLMQNAASIIVRYHRRVYESFTVKRGFR